jgi:hypothetical protein
MDMGRRVWGVTSPLSTLSGSQKTAITAQIQYEMTYLLSGSNYVSGHWVTPGQQWNAGADCNIDRFVLVDVMEDLYKLKNANLLPSLVPGWLTSVQVAVNYQYNNYGQGIHAQNPDWSTNLAGSYPNMDAAYTFIMGVAGLAYGNTSYTASAKQFALSLLNITESCGTIPYVTVWAPDMNYTNMVNDWLHLVSDQRHDGGKGSGLRDRAFRRKQQLDCLVGELGFEFIGR